MIFRTDKQTISDIELFSDKNRSNSLFAFYNRTVTTGGSDRLYKIIQQPISDIHLLEDRKQEIRFFHKLDSPIIIHKRQIDFIEFYLKNTRTPLKDNFIDATKDRIADKIKADSDYYTIKQGIIHILNLLIDLRRFTSEIGDDKTPLTLVTRFQKIKDFIAIKSLNNVLTDSTIPDKEPKFFIINKLDYLFRKTNLLEIREILDILYELDVLQSLALLMKEEHLTLPEFTTNPAPVFEGESCYHPLLEKSIANNFNFKEGTTLCFLTGSNMSGKSTFLKTIAINVYLSHLGFPVPAGSLKISIVNGLFTTINLSDNLNLGLSHFYAEVKRIKDISNEIKSTKNIFVVFDELFRGTNVKDAYDATLMVVKSLSQIKSSMFLISSHILEVAENLTTSEHIDFRCFKTRIQHRKAMYDYKISEGVSKERFGMQIIENEEIESILKSIIESQKN